MHLHSEFEEAQIFCCACFYDHYLILINKSYQSFENNNVCFHDKVMEKRNLGFVEDAEFSIMLVLLVYITL